MTQQQETTIDWLNRLHEAEMRTLMPRLDVLQLAGSRVTAPQSATLLRLFEQAGEHRAWLIEEIESARGVVRPATLDIHSASVHYLSWSSAIPRLEADVQRLLALYAQAAGDRSLSGTALELAHRISRRYETVLQALRAAARSRPPLPEFCCQDATDHL